MAINLRKSVPHLVMLVYVVVILVPFVFILFSSFKANNLEIATHPFGLPKSWEFGNYKEAWVKAKINVYFFNSLYLAFTAAAAGVLLAAATAFAITRMKFRRTSNWIYQFVLIGMLIPGNVLFIAQYLLVQKLGILDTHWSLFLPYTAGALPFSVLLVSAFMKAIPHELEEAAVVDGMGVFRMFVQIILPLTVPALVTVFIVNFLGNWNEYLLSFFFISKDALRTLPSGMVQFRDAFQTNYALVCTGIVFSVVPVLVMYAFLQRKIIEGLTAGSVKG
ncbi:carbohydrate ABC transporter permease [Cohnella thailandensis]|uniref:Carbohydrate ABC transporter permease n=1 Tax=Cohnella thailandensis TaxID=557557 RepID=A0A841SYY4_9BACL|nr:carbohydrate ABC transporter permease [Cohnella thailandensis]MBB6636099.1 carbohydrate ABC transporter permease [Cohnella thailandensis]MBP1973932.1 raffinose/stachyose/melibiose transport system permease protein [Cohnella thailandensis]